MARKTIKMLLEEKGKKILEKIKDIKRQQGERVALLAVESGVTDLEISDSDWKEIFEKVKERFHKPKENEKPNILQSNIFEQNL